MDFSGALTTNIGAFQAAIQQGQPGGLPVPGDDLVGMYAVVTDLFGVKTDRVLCTSYLIGGVKKCFWEPLRPLSPNVAPMLADQNIILRPLQSPTIVRLTGGMTANRTITADKTNAYPGLTYDIMMTGALNLFTLSVAGLAAGSVLSLLMNTRRTIYFDGTDFQVF